MCKLNGGFVDTNKLFKMYRLYIIILSVTVTVSGNMRSPSASQLVTFKKKNEGHCKIMTTSAGSPIEYMEVASTLNTDLISNDFLIESMTHTVRERIPERVVHAKGAGGFGYFEVTHDITDICDAKLFSEVGKKTPVAVRFSPVVVDRGGVDTSREPRGFAIKFYTEDGNFDLVALNVPIFSIKDPILFSTFVHILKRNPANNLHDPNMLWDFLTENPAGLHMFLFVFGDQGIPKGYRYMPGFGIHTFQVVNKLGVSSFIRFHILPDAGIQNLYADEARNITGMDPDYATRDLYDALGEGNYPSWTISAQILSADDVKNAKLDVFDVTKVLPLDVYPLQPIGKLVLDRNPTNHFAEIEQLAYCPGNLVPGIVGSPDKLFESRRLSYRDSLNYRLGGNFNKIKVNCPMRNPAYTYNRDGEAPVGNNDGDAPNYYPNSFNGLKPYVDENSGELIKIHEKNPDNFEQIAELYTNGMTEEERVRLIENIVGSLKTAAEFLQKRAVKVFTEINIDLGNRVKQGLNINDNKGEGEHRGSCQD